MTSSGSLSGTLSGTAAETTSGTAPATTSGVGPGALVGFLPRDGTGVEELEARLVSAGLHADASTPVRRTYYDTFDARLYRAGWVLEHERILDGDGAPSARADASWLRLRPLGSPQATVEHAAATMPRRPDDLTDARLRSRLGELAGGRA